RGRDRGTSDSEAVPPKTHRARLQCRQHLVEQLWSRAVAAERSPPQTLKTQNRRKQAETVAIGFAPSLEHLDGKEGVDGSSPSEGFRKGQQMAFFVAQT